jgi:hypothetical protein
MAYLSSPWDGRLPVMPFMSLRDINGLSMACIRRNTLCALNRNDIMPFNGLSSPDACRAARSLVLTNTHAASVTMPVRPLNGLNVVCASFSQLPSRFLSLRRGFVLLYFFSAIFLPGTLRAQNVGIGIATPDNSALLQLQTTTLGFLPPRMSDAQIQSISSPATGDLTYSTT